LGLFLFIINGLMILLVAWLMPQFHVAGLASGVWASVIVGLTSWLANGVTGGRKMVEVRSIKNGN
jgi:putative membrane protein